MIPSFYMPVVRTKQGEFNALNLLNPNLQGWVVPLIEVANIEFDNEEGKKPKTIEQHLNTIVRRIMNKWCRSNAFLDTHYINGTTPGNINPVTYLYDRLSKSIAFPSPALRLSTPETIKEAMKDVMSKYKLNEVAIRIFIEDLAGPDFAKELEQLLNYFHLAPSNAHLVLDLEAADFSKVEDFSDSILEQLKSFPYFKDWKSFTICGGSFPATNLLKKGPSEVIRGEWVFYNSLMEKLKKEKFNRHINYGDYGIIAPGHFVYDVRRDRSANIRYTHDNVWYVIKGSSIKQNGNDQYITLAKQVVQSDYFFNEHFSDGDRHLTKCASNQTKTAGNTTVWKRVGFNHHFEKVMVDLLASYLAV
jgi:hypothetical protein